MDASNIPQNGDMALDSNGTAQPSMAVPQNLRPGISAGRLEALLLSIPLTDLKMRLRSTTVK